MLRLSKLTDYATVILSFMAREKTQVAAMEIAAVTGIALPTVSKILKSLVNAEVLVSTRGAKGGYALARMPEEISVATVINALEGPIALTECSISHQGCEQALGCDIGGNWSLINQTIHNALESVTLADLIRPAVLPNEVFIPVSSLYR
ncbi:MAG: SUF system Fe-S cluster assembly regulator [Methylobacter sp.]|jgi:FeS assembly SUF system regulator|nr:SUF system Fe-S cluster assembly regulator [Methylobacter sp.]MDP2097775.1 SUF system Fe-S cluster assembly regulator [Methylobacter sp.]MDP2427744.1 SUF system Fe-S cluster assembly regulator [Methylobacter sp.]MDP3053949.1 SUF system Fe-S cluster assembly regulator [Methylobacter sp.]MDP3361680.1 SUF system Fe-S cluster assembly regulator [Methylobacter sp.]